MTAITPIKRENDSSNNTGTLQTSFQEVDIERNDLPFSPGVPGYYHQYIQGGFLMGGHLQIQRIKINKNMSCSLHDF
jgi:hypothetical protein